MNTKYNGWKNYQTWNTSLWINNDEGLYRSACDYAKTSNHPSYMGFIKAEGLVDVRTPDNVSFSGTRLDYKALNNMIKELQ